MNRSPSHATAPCDCAICGGVGHRRGPASRRHVQEVDEVEDVVGGRVYPPATYNREPMVAPAESSRELPRHRRIGRHSRSPAWRGRSRFSERAVGDAVPCRSRDIEQPACNLLSAANNDGQRWELYPCAVYCHVDRAHTARSGACQCFKALITACGSPAAMTRRLPVAR